MKKFILKQLLTVLFVTSTLTTVPCSSEEKQAHADFIHKLIKNTADFIDFSIEWTSNFFDTNNRTSFEKFAHQFADATEKFDQIVIKPLVNHLPHNIKQSPYHQALTIGKEIACTLHTQANHVCSILKKHVKNRNATMVGLALKQTEKYTSSNMIKELEKKFERLTLELRKVDPEIANYADQMGRNVIESRRFQHDMSMATQFKALSHRLKC